MNTNHNGTMICGQYRLLCTIPDLAISKSDRQIEPSIGGAGDRIEGRAK